MADDIKARRDRLVHRVPSDDFIEKEHLLSLSAFEEGVPRRKPDEDLRILLDVGKLVQLEPWGTDLSPQIWKPGRAYEEARRKNEEKERAAQARIVRGTGSLKAAVGILKQLSGPEGKAVERSVFKAELIKAKYTDEEAEKVIRTMFREGITYESKPGFIRRFND